MLKKLKLNTNMLKVCLNCASLKKKKNLLECRKLFLTNAFMRRNGISYIKNNSVIFGLH